MTDDTQKKIRDTAQFMADMVGRSEPSVRVASAAVLLSSLVVASVKPDKRMELFETLVEQMRHHISQAGIKERKANGE